MPKSCICTHLEWDGRSDPIPAGSNPEVEGDFKLVDGLGQYDSKWFGADCQCCVHLQARGQWSREFCQKYGCVKRLGHWRVTSLGHLLSVCRTRTIGQAYGAPLGGFMMETVFELDFGIADRVFERCGLENEQAIALWNDLVKYQEIWHECSRVENVEFSDEDFVALAVAAGAVEDEEEGGGLPDHQD